MCTKSNLKKGDYSHIGTAAPLAYINTSINKPNTNPRHNTIAQLLPPLKLNLFLMLVVLVLLFTSCVYCIKRQSKPIEKPAINGEALQNVDIDAAAANGRFVIATADRDVDDDKLVL